MSLEKLTILNQFPSDSHVQMQFIQVFPSFFPKWLPEKVKTAILKEVLILRNTKSSQNYEKLTICLIYNSKHLLFFSYIYNLMDYQFSVYFKDSKKWVVDLKAFSELWLTLPYKTYLSSLSVN